MPEIYHCDFTAEQRDQLIRMLDARRRELDTFADQISEEDIDLELRLMDEIEDSIITLR